MAILEKKYRELLARDKSSLFGLNTSTEDFHEKNVFRYTVSWHIPSKSLIDELILFSPIVSVGCGHAYTESLASERGADIICTDLSPHQGNGWCRGDKFYMPIEKLTARKAVLKYPKRNVFMAWPPYDHPVAYQAVKAMNPGMFLIYVGEPYGGCTGDQSFFCYLNKHFVQSDTNAKIDNWMGLHDGVYVYMKK